MHRFVWSTLFLFTLFAPYIHAQESDPRLLTVERLFRSGEFSEQGAPGLTWSERSSHYYDTRGGEKGWELVKIEPVTEAAEVLAVEADFIPAGRDRALNLHGYEFSIDETKLLIYTNSRRVWRQNTRGDYWVLDLASKKLHKLGGDAAESTLMFAKFSPDGSRVAYVRENNLYVESCEDGAITQLTTDGSDTIVNGTSDWVNEEELDIRDAFRWSPDGQSIAYWQFDTSDVPRFTMIDNTSQKYPTTQVFPYPKVGETNSAVRVGVVRLENSETTWMQLPGDPRQHYIAHVEWTTDGSGRLAIQQFDRLQQTNRVMLANAISGDAETIYTETDSAWVENSNPFRWIDDGDRFLWLSEQSGYRHLYSISIDGSSVKAVTSGDWDVIDVEGMDHDARIAYFSASPHAATQNCLFKVSFDGDDVQNVTGDSRLGWHNYNISPNGKFASHSYSTFSTPPVHDFVSLPNHEVIRTWTTNEQLREKLAGLAMPKAELIQLEIEPGVTLDVSCMTPQDLDPTKKYPIFVHVYGEPWGQTVRDSWPGRQGLWHAMLAQKGYIVLSIDNRGTKVPRGREFRKCIYRQIGILAPRDQAAAIDAFCAKYEYADPNRVGIWGWSGGGSMTLNALFHFPEKYHLGIAVAPEPNQLLYDTIYQERYMGLPSDNADNFHAGSPVNHAANLQGELLIVHGTADDNCHYQGTEQLINQLVANGKHFSVIPYPGRSHSLGEGNNTIPHLYSTMTWFIEKGLPAGGQ